MQSLASWVSNAKQMAIEALIKPAKLLTVRKMGCLGQQFTEHFGKAADAGNAPTSRRTPVVAPARRGGKAPRRVELNQSQVNLARKLGLTPEQYAQQLVKEMGNG